MTNWPFIVNEEAYTLAYFYLYVYAGNASLLPLLQYVTVARGAGFSKICRERERGER